MMVNNNTTFYLKKAAVEVGGIVKEIVLGNSEHAFRKGEPIGG